MRRATLLIMAGAFLFSCGGQWAVLQGVAWIGMIHEYAQMVPLGEAVSMTFSGKYPCAICKAIAERRQSENNKACALEKYEKKSLPPIPSLVAVEAIASAVEFPDYLNALGSRRETPPTPPPRQA
jgi:hypothetical protein